jgi:L-amino acid N-acyltransferase YncA
MSVVYTVESYTAAIPEIKLLVPGQWDESALAFPNLDQDVNYDAYSSAEEKGMTSFVAARIDGEMVGYIGAIVAPHLSAKRQKSATVTPYYVKPLPQRGFILRRLIVILMDDLRSRGVVLFTMRTHPHISAEALFLRLGFQESDRTYTIPL